MKVLHVLAALLFVAFAVVQFNDPDPLGWVAIYLGVAVTAILYLIGRNVSVLGIAGTVVCAVGMLLLLPDFFYWLTHGTPTITGSMKAESPHVELVREFLGFLIAGVVYFAYFRGNLKRFRA